MCTFDENCNVIAKDLEENPPKVYCGPWSCFNRENNIVIGGIKEIQELAKAITTCDKSYALHVTDSLYLYNSEVHIYSNDCNDKKLLVLPKTGVVIDLFNDVKEEDYQEVLSLIGCQDYIFYTLNEAYNATKLLQSTNPISKCYEGKRHIEKGEDIFIDGTMIADKITNHKNAWSIFLNLLFHGKHNWAIGKSYFDMSEELKNKLLSFNVICYESLSDLNEEDHGSFYVETQPQLNNSEALFTYEPFVIFAGLSPKTPEALRFLGIFKMDKQRSLIENHLVFNKFRDSIYLDTYSMG